MTRGKRGQLRWAGRAAKGLLAPIVLWAGLATIQHFRGGTGSVARADTAKTVSVTDGGVFLGMFETNAATVAAFLSERHIGWREGDGILPAPEAFLTSGTRIVLVRAQTASIRAEGNVRTIRTQLSTVEEALTEAGVALGEDDIVVPPRGALLSTDTSIVVTRVVVREETVDKPIAFETTVSEDAALSWRKTIVTQKGKNGVHTYRYRVSYHDGKEVARRLLGSDVTADPVGQSVTQGTFVKTGRSRSGGASWYRYTGTLAAASLWLPHGSFARVTNTDNGKSVIVKINDSGPYVGGRIVDLDQVAFTKIASIGAGVINVKMEEIVN